MVIEGGYYIKARQIQNSEIMNKPPHFREIWDWLLKEANHKDTKICKRGQLIRSYYDILEGLAWFVGYRKHKYKYSQCENAMKWLSNKNMITKTNTTRGLLITITNYDTYQNPKSYEHETVNGTNTVTNNVGSRNDKQECKEETIKNVNKERVVTHNGAIFVKPTLEDLIKYFKEKGIGENEASKFYDSYEMKGWKVGKAGTLMQDWKAAVRNWIKYIQKYGGETMSEETPQQRADETKRRLAKLRGEI